MYTHTHTHTHFTQQSISLETELDKIFCDERCHFTVESGISTWNIYPLASTNNPTKDTHAIGVNSTGEPTLLTVTMEAWQRVHVKTVARFTHLTQRSPHQIQGPLQGKDMH